MAGQNVNIYTSNWHYTGVNISIAQAAFDLTINWTDVETGEAQTWSGEVVWPNDFSFLSADARKHIIEELTLRIARIRLGIGGEA